VQLEQVYWIREQAFKKNSSAQNIQKKKVEISLIALFLQLHF